MNDECIFCKIANGEVPAKVVYRNDDIGVIAIEDANPQAPTHILVLPRAHYGTLHALVCDMDETLLPNLIEVASNIGTARGGDGGYRLVVNTGRDPGQTVAHLHLHVLAGRRMSWPPG